MILIYDQTGVPGSLDGLIRAIEGRVFLRSAAHYSGPEKASRVYTDSEEIAADYAERGVAVYDLEGEPVAEPAQDGAQSVGGGWYDVVIDGEVVDRVQGRGAAEARYEEITGAPDNDHNDNTE